MLDSPNSAATNLHLTNSMATYPTFDEAAQSPEFQQNTEGSRLICRIEEPIETAIYVMANRYDIDGPKEPFFTGDPSAPLHPIAEASIYNQPISEMTIIDGTLEDYEHSWWAIHEGDVDANRACEGCGYRRGPPPPELVVKAEDKGFITIGDYVKAVHPWLMQNRQRLLLALADECIPLPSSAKLIYQPIRANYIMSVTEETFIQKQHRLAKMLRDGYIA